MNASKIKKRLVGKARVKHKSIISDIGIELQEQFSEGCKEDNIEQKLIIHQAKSVVSSSKVH